MSAAATLAWQPLLGGLQLIEHELLLFAAFWFVLGILDELAIDLTWIWLRLTGRARARRLDRTLAGQPLAGRLAVFVPAWHEAEVIGAMIAHTLRSWPQTGLTLYVGCYGNDAGTLAAAIGVAGDDPRLRIVVHGRQGPTTKADCLNRLYAAMAADEARRGMAFTGVVLHDAEDMVHPAALPVIDQALARVDFVQLPVRPEPQPGSPWIAGHYADEFTEAHAKTMVVRDALGAAIPAAGVGCGFARTVLGKLADIRVGQGESGPFASECLTEDYELGLLVSRDRSRGRFLRLRDTDGSLVATRSFFPATLDESVRQKARWVHGIALQGWDRMGWEGRPVDLWMALRDRRGPLTAVVLLCAYVLLLIEGVLAGARLLGWQEHLVISPMLAAMLTISFIGFGWRAVMRFAFTAREYGAIEGLRAALRIPIGNVIAIMAGRRALSGYIRSLRGEIVGWDKTRHDAHPASQLAEPATP